MWQYLSEEGEGEEGEDDEEEERRRLRRRRARKKKTSVYDVYEPSELERGFLTERDSEIRVTDVPERFQVSTGRVLPRKCCHMVE